MLLLSLKYSSLIQSPQAGEDSIYTESHNGIPRPILASRICHSAYFHEQILMTLNWHI